MQKQFRKVVECLTSMRVTLDSRPRTDKHITCSHCPELSGPSLPSYVSDIYISLENHAVHHSAVNSF